MLVAKELNLNHDPPTMIPYLVLLWGLQTLQPALNQALMIGASDFVSKY